MKTTYPTIKLRQKLPDFNLGINSEHAITLAARITPWIAIKFPNVMLQLPIASHDPQTEPPAAGSFVAVDAVVGFSFALLDTIAWMFTYTNHAARQI